MVKRLIILTICILQILTAYTQTILVYTKNGEGYVHDNIEECVKMMRRIGDAEGYSITHSDDPSIMNDDDLSGFDLIIFANSNNEGFDTDQQRLAFQHYIMKGGSFMGIHSASGSERNWPWFWKILGGKFKRHPRYQEFEIVNLIPDHPATTHLGETWTWTDECYFLDHLNPSNTNVLAARLSSIEDEGKVDYPGETYGDLFPIAWQNELYGGRQFYTALGHSKEFYSNPVFEKHITGAISWVLAVPPGKSLNTRLPTELIKK